MFAISIYTGGEVENATMGVTYNKPPSASYPAEDDITFDELKRVIFQLTGIDEGKNGINVNARWNAGSGGSICFTLLPICNNSMWRMVVEKTLSGASIVELFVDLVPISGPTQNGPREKSHQSGELGETSKKRGRKSQKKDLEGEVTDDEFKVKPCGELDLYAGRFFDSIGDLKRAIKEYHVRQNRKFITDISSKNGDYIVKCEAAPKCGWRLYARAEKNGSCFQIKTIRDEHVCSNEGDGGDHRNLTAEFISGPILDLIRNNADVSVRDIQEFVLDRYACWPSYGKAWRAKEMAKANLFGKRKDSCSDDNLRLCFNAIQVANPGTKVGWWSDDTSDTTVRPFRGVAWAFAPAMEGFMHCRPVIGIDSTPLCGKYGNSGTLVLAVAYDAEGQVLPLAFAVVKVEDDASWSWFMSWLRAEVVGPRPLCVISDRRESISRLFYQTDSGWCTGMGHAFHRYCSRYFCESFRTAFKKDDLVNLVKWVSTQNQPSKFRLGMLRIMETDRDAYDWLVKVGTKPKEDSVLQILETDREASYNWLVKVGGTKSNEESTYHLWSLCEDGGRRYGIMAINGNESVFEMFPKIQELPITALVDLTFAKSAELFTRKGEAASKIDAAKQPWSNKTTAILEARRVKAMQHLIAGFQSQNFRSRPEAGIEVEVETRSNVKHMVILGNDQRSCTCQKPQLTGIPCSHLLAVCAFRSFSLDHFVDSTYSTRQLLSTWAPQFHPLPEYAVAIAYDGTGSSGKRGRKRKHFKLRTSPFKYRCSLCREMGHTKNKCLTKSHIPDHSREMGHTKNKSLNKSHIPDHSRSYNLTLADASSLAM